MAFGTDTDPSVGKDTQFPPGVSGNPAGKPAGTKHISTWIQDLMEDEEFEALLPDPRDGWKTYKGAPMPAILKVMSIKAMQGDVKAFDALAKYGYGTKLDLTTNGKELPAPILGGVAQHVHTDNSATEAPQA
jgi:hypothetical protein